MIPADLVSVLEVALGVPPPGAVAAIHVFASEYLAKVQTALGTAHKPSVLLVAIGGLMRGAVRVGMSDG